MHELLLDNRRLIKVEVGSLTIRHLALPLQLTWGKRIPLEHINLLRLTDRLLLQLVVAGEVKPSPDRQAPAELYGVSAVAR